MAGSQIGDRTVPGAVVHGDHLVRGLGLAGDRVQAPVEPPPAVPDRDDDRDAAPAHPRYRRPRAPTARGRARDLCLCVVRARRPAGPRRRPRHDAAVGRRAHRRPRRRGGRLAAQRRAVAQPRPAGRRPARAAGRRARRPPGGRADPARGGRRRADERPGVGGAGAVGHRRPDAPSSRSAGWPLWCRPSTDDLTASSRARAPAPPARPGQTSAASRGSRRPRCPPRGARHRRRRPPPPPARRRCRRPSAVAASRFPEIAAQRLARLVLERVGDRQHPGGRHLDRHEAGMRRVHQGQADVVVAQHAARRRPGSSAAAARSATPAPSGTDVSGASGADPVAAPSRRATSPARARALSASTPSSNMLRAAWGSGRA